MSKNIATSSEVRAWSVKAGLREATAPTVGRLSEAEVAAFNKAHRSQEYTPGVKPASTIAVKVPTTDKRGRNITKTVRVESSALRAAVGAEGQRGRVPAEAARQYVIGAGLV